MNNVRDSVSLSSVTPYREYCHTALLSLLSSGKREKIDELTKRFDRFKKQFDRGIAVQSVGTLETLLEEMGMALHQPFKANH